MTSKNEQPTEENIVDIKQPSVEEKVVNKISEYYSFFTLKPREFKSLTDFWIVLDLDETLVHTFREGCPLSKVIEDKQDLIELSSRLYEFDLLDPGYPKDQTREVICGIKRPSLRMFLHFCNFYFKGVTIWSAGAPHYVQKIVNEIFKDNFAPFVVYDKNKTIIIENEDETIVQKPLKQMFKNEYLKSLGMTKKNTFIIDDREDTFSKNVINGIQIPRYAPELAVEILKSDDPALKQLMFWFFKDEVINCKDVSKLEHLKTRIFKEPYDTSILKSCKIQDFKKYPFCKTFFEGMAAVYEPSILKRNVKTPYSKRVGS